ncbi:MAG: hypothetical protein DWQ05_10045 [Calditrichaeota bacterium]|nr:MAG: hypothetical protein DWQ05_10045 [Calditrichota bacterium]
MHLLNTLFLPILGAAVLIPVIIHMIWRNKAIRIDFPAMRFLMTNKKPISRWLRWKQILLLLMRMLIFALLALLFARPYFANKTLLPLWDDAEKEVLIIYDNSASMSYERHQRKAREELNAILDGFTEKTMVSFLTTGFFNKTVIESAPLTTAVKELIKKNLEPDFGVGNLHDALRKADNYLATLPNTNREIYLISDFQIGNWPEYIRDMNLQSKARIKLLPVADADLENLSVTEIAIPRQPGDGFHAQISQKNLKSMHRIDLQLQLNNREMGKATVPLDENEDNNFTTFKKVPLPLTSQMHGSVSFRVDDAFDFDNQLHFVLNQKRKVRILAINGEKMPGVADELFYLRSALEIKNSAFELVESIPMQANSVGIQGFDIVLLANVRGLDQQSIQQLKSFVQKGGSIIFALGDKIDQQLFNTFFSELAACTLIGKAYADVQSQVGEILLAENTEHKIVEKSIGSGNSNSRFYQYWKLRPRAGAARIFSFPKGNAAIFESRIGEGKSIVIAFPVDSEWSNLPVQSEFLPLFHSLFAYCAPERLKNAYINVGDPISLGKDFDLTNTIKITDPAGRTVSQRLPLNVFTNTDAPGVYSFSQNGKQMQVAVNVDRRESETEFYTAESFQARLSTDGEISSNNQVLRAGQFSEIDIEQQQKLWRFILLSLLLLIIAETVFANRVPR